MTYEEIVEMVRKAFEYADARNIFEHVAFQINIVGEGAGAFYIEVAERQMCVEPYDYYDRDGLVTCSADVLKSVCSEQISVRKAYETGLIKFEGDLRKLDLCIENIKLCSSKK